MARINGGGLTFEWDSEKADANAAKHGVTFEEVMGAFADTLSVTVYDPDHSEGEARLVLIGATRRDRLVVVVFA